MVKILVLCIYQLFLESLFCWSQTKDYILGVTLHSFDLKNGQSDLNLVLLELCIQILVITLLEKVSKKPIISNQSQSYGGFILKEFLFIFLLCKMLYSVSRLWLIKFYGLNSIQNFTASYYRDHKFKTEIDWPFKLLIFKEFMEKVSLPNWP